ncbi:MAG: DUF4214 domain-containing protein [Burkholderiales bacterium]|nr:DUF4214 domain-containing protein [Burkholderiales bacterium]
MSTWKLFQPLDVTTTDVLSLGADTIAQLLSSSLLRQTRGERTLDVIGSGLRLLDGKLLPIGEISRINLSDGLHEVLQVLDAGWSLLKILSYYNPLTDRWNLDGLLDYLFREADRFEGSSGDDRFAGHAGDDTLDGRAGLDIAEYSGLRAGFALTRSASGWQLVDQRGNEGRDQLIGIERLQFADGGLALDLDGHAGAVARLLGTLFGPTALTRADWVGAGLALLDQGLDTAQLAEMAASSSQFADQAGSHSNADFVRWVYRNVTGEVPTPAQLAPYVDLLDNGTYTQGALGLLASETSELAAQIDLVGLFEAGLPFALGA